MVLRLRGGDAIEDDSDSESMEEQSISRLKPKPMMKYGGGGKKKHKKKAAPSFKPT